MVIYNSAEACLQNKQHLLPSVHICAKREHYSLCIILCYDEKVMCSNPPAQLTVIFFNKLKHELSLSSNTDRRCCFGSHLSARKHNYLRWIEIFMAQKWKRNKAVAMRISYSVILVERFYSRAAASCFCVQQDVLQNVFILELDNKKLQCLRSWPAVHVLVARITRRRELRKHLHSNSLQFQGNRWNISIYIKKLLLYFFISCVFSVPYWLLIQT